MDTNIETETKAPRKRAPKPAGDKKVRATKTVQERAIALFIKANPDCTVVDCVTFKARSKREIGVRSRLGGPTMRWSYSTSTLRPITPKAS